MGHLSSLWGWACRQPSYSLRVNTMRISLQDLRSRLLAIAVETEASPYLPHDFLQVRQLFPWRPREVVHKVSL